MRKWRSWSRFSEYDNAIDSDELSRLAEDNFVSHSMPGPGTHLDVVNAIAQRATTPINIESVSETLADMEISRCSSR